jgi:hypothetical protein
MGSGCLRGHTSMAGVGRSQNLDWVLIKILTSENFF